MSIADARLVFFHGQNYVETYCLMYSFITGLVSTILLFIPFQRLCFRLLGHLSCESKAAL